jgi:predicted metalloprotease
MTKRMHRRWLACLILLPALVAGCSAGGSGGYDTAAPELQVVTTTAEPGTTPPPADNRTTTTPEDSTPPAPPDTAHVLPGTPTAAGACQPPSLANCFTEETMDDYFNAVIPLVEQFFDTSYSAMSHPAGYTYIDIGMTGQMACKDTSGSTLATDEAFAYCPADGNIYIGEAAGWGYYHADGDAAPAVGLAHEWGHHIQDQVGVPTPTTVAESVVYESQADCIAGAWLGFVRDNGHLEEQDPVTVAKLLDDIAAAEGDPNRDHGDLSERTDSLIHGLDGGLEACNDFYPTYPIITSE